MITEDSISSSLASSAYLPPKCHKTNATSDPAFPRHRSFRYQYIAMKSDANFHSFLTQTKKQSPVAHVVLVTATSRFPTSRRQ